MTTPSAAARTPTAPGEHNALRTLAVRGGLWSAASQILPAAGTAVLSVAAGRYLGSGPLGQQSLIAYVNAAVAAVVVIALNTALLQVGGRLQGEGRRTSLHRLVRWAFVAHLFAGLVVLVVMAAAGVAAGRYHVAWIVIGVVSVLDAVADAFAVRLILTEGWAPVGRLRLVFQLVGPVFGLALLFTGYGVTGIFVGDGLAALGLLVPLALRYRRVSRTVELPVSPSEVDESDLAAEPHRALRPPVAVLGTFVLFAFDALITQVVTKRVEFVVLAVFATSSAIGQYSVAFMAVSLIAMVPLGVASAAMPLIARSEGAGQADRAIHHLRFALRLGTMLALAVVALLAAVGPAAVIAVYGSGYTTAARLLPVAAVSLLVSVVGGVCAQYWAGRARLGIVLRAGCLAGVVDIGVACVAVPSLSAMGAVLANLAGQLTLAGALLTATVRRTGPIGWRADGLVRMLIAAGGAAVAACAVRIAGELLPLGLEWRAVSTLVVGSAVAVATLLWISRALGLFAADEADWLTSLLPRRLHRMITERTIGAVSP